MRLFGVSIFVPTLVFPWNHWQAPKSFSWLAFEVFVCLYVRVTRRFMLRMQRELNSGDRSVLEFRLSIGRLCVQFTGLSMGHICLSHPIAIYAWPIPSHGISIIILIWNTIQLKLLNLWKFRFWLNLIDKSI